MLCSLPAEWLSSWSRILRRPAAGQQQEPAPTRDSCQSRRPLEEENHEEIQATPAVPPYSAPADGIVLQPARPGPSPCRKRRGTRHHRPATHPSASRHSVVKRQKIPVRRDSQHPRPAPDPPHFLLGRTCRRAGIPVTLPNGKQKPFHWVRNGKVLLSLGVDTFTITEYRFPASLNFRRDQSANLQSTTAFELKQGQVVPFNQVLHQWGPGPYQYLQLMVLPGEQQNQFRVCFNISIISTHSLVCNTWQVPHSWNYLHTLHYVGPYLDEGSSKFRYRP